MAVIKALMFQVKGLKHSVKAPEGLTSPAPYEHLEMLSNVSARRGETDCRETEAYQRFDIIGVVSSVIKGHKLSRRIICRCCPLPKYCRKDVFHEDMVTHGILFVFPA